MNNNAPPPIDIDGVKRVVVDGKVYYASMRGVERFRDEENEPIHIYENLTGDTMTDDNDEDVLFDGDDVSNWDPVDQQSSGDFNDYDLEFIDMDNVEEGDFWVGEYTGIREIGGIENALFDNDDEELTYAFTPHAILRSQLAESDKDKDGEVVERGETVAVMYKGTREVEGRPIDAHVWEVRRPPE